MHVQALVPKAQPRSASAARSNCGAVKALSPAIIVFDLTVESDTKPSRALTEGGFSAFKDVADSFTNC